MQIELTDEIIEAINNALMDGIPCIVATVGDNNMPNLAYKGSVIAFDREHLAFWERSSGETLTALRRIPKVAVLYRNPATRLSWRIYGNATLHENGSLREEIMEMVPEIELERDPDRVGIAVFIRVDRVRAGRQTIMQRGENLQDGGTAGH